MLSLIVAEGQQVPLIHEVHADDDIIDGEWFEIFHDFSWADYREHAAADYDALYEFSINERQPIMDAGEATAETKEEANERLLFGRATMQQNDDQPPQIIYLS